MHIKALKLLCVFLFFVFLFVFLPLSLGALVFLAVLYSLTAQLLQFRNRTQKRSSWLGAVSRVHESPSLLSSLSSIPSFLSFSIQISTSQTERHASRP